MSHLRITGGQARGQKVAVPKVAEVRPSPDRARTTLFNWLMAFPPPQSALDLFSGSGILGFESLSRGAKEAHLVDLNTKVISQLKLSATKWSYGKVQIYNSECLKWLDNHQHLAPFDLIFIDPPFDRPELLRESLKSIASMGYLSPHGALYFEQPVQTKVSLPASFETYREKKFGHVLSTLVQRQH